MKIPNYLTIRGKLITVNPTTFIEAPINNIGVQLRKRFNLFSKKTPDVFTQKEGQFEINYPLSYLEKFFYIFFKKWFFSRNYYLHILDYTTLIKNKKLKKKYYSIKSIHCQNFYEVSLINLNKINISFWEHNPNFKIPRTFITNDTSLIPKQTYSRRYLSFSLQLKSIIPVIFNTIPYLFNGHKVILKTITKAFPKKNLVGDYIFSDDFISDMVLNGFNPSILEKYPEKNHFYLEFNWDDLQIDTKHIALNSRANFFLENEKLHLKSIDIWSPNTGIPIHIEKKRYTSQDPEWERVKLIFRSNYFTFGELTTHLSLSHLNIEQYLIPLYRHIKLSPISFLLRPHSYGTISINAQANDFLLSPTGLIPLNTPLTENSTTKILLNQIGQLDWKNWRPRNPLCSNDRYAKAANLFWKILNEYVDDFFNTHLSDIQKYWEEIHEFSNALVRNSVPATPISKDLYNFNEFSRGILDNHSNSSEQKAVSAITHQITSDQEEIQNLKNMCCYIIFHSTFQHTWVNSRQYDYGNFFNFSLTGTLKNPLDLNIELNELVSFSGSTFIPAATYFLSKLYDGLVFKEKDKVDKLFIQLLKSHTKEFKQMGLDIDKLYISISI